jgi:tetratricopeptide (TPR) repeat protein
MKIRRKHFLKTSACIQATIISALLLLTGAIVYGQEIDPFYLNLLEKGEKSLLEGNYSKAIEELEIAVFGLSKEKRLEAKAYVYISLSYYYLNNLEQSKVYLKEAQKLVEANELQDLDLHESVWTDLESLVNSFRAETAQERQLENIREKYEAEDLSLGVAGEEKASSSLERDLRITRKLEKDIEDDPRNTSLYYDLYLLYKNSNNILYAKRTLEDLIKNNPSEIQGHYLLGKLEFKEKDYEEAEKIFEKILSLFERTQADENIISEIKAYLILASYLRGKENKAQELVSSWMSDFTEEKISSFSIDIEDKEKLQRIVNAVKSRAEAGRDKIRIKRLEAEIKKEPRDTPLYYELYELYSKSSQLKDAREILEDLLKNNPDEVAGVFLLGKTEYRLNRYREALERFRRMVVVSDESYAERELFLKSMIYVCLCLRHLEQEGSLRSYLDSLYGYAQESEIMRLVREEGLEQEWNRIRLQ